MKNKYISKRYWKDSSTEMSAVDDKLRAFDDIINLSIGDTDINTPKIIMEKAFQDAYDGHTKYTDSRGYVELRDTISLFYKEEYKMDVKDENIMVTAGGCISMFLALEAILDDNDEVIVHTPCFTPYFQQIELSRGIPVVLETFEEENFQINIEKLESLITERTKAIILNTPGNPTGACMSLETLKNIAKVCIKHDILVVADDIYRLYCFNEPFVPISSIDGMFDRTITINSFSKDYCMTGFRIGNIIANKDIIKTIQLINENVMYTATSISQRAAIYALENRREVQPPIFEEYKKRVLYSADRISKITNMSVHKPQGSFYLFVNIKNTGLSSKEVSELLLDEAHILVIPGNAFGDAGEGYIRIALTCGVEKLKEAFDRIEKMKIFS